MPEQVQPAAAVPAPSCATCKWAIPSPIRPGWVECHRYPPTDGPGGSYRYPIDPTGWCGDFEKL